jgi:hypothetical protein
MQSLQQRFYLKKLTPNELGYRKGKLTTGQMFFISKLAADFFPQLSKDINNDCVKIRVKGASSDCISYLNLVYHNDKHNTPGGSRDEYRIYLNTDIAPHPRVFEPHDILIFERIETDFYILNVSKPESDGYEKLSQKIAANKLRGNHALLDSL